MSFKNWLQHSTQRSISAKEKINAARLVAMEDELKECTFQPRSPHQSHRLPQPKSKSSSSKPKSNYKSLYRRQANRQQTRELKSQQAQIHREKLELEKCTFQPNISPNTEKILRQKQQRLIRQKREENIQSPRYTRTLRTPIQRQQSPINDSLINDSTTMDQQHVTLRQLSAVFQTAWEGLLSHQYSYRRPTPQLNKYLNNQNTNQSNPNPKNPKKPLETLQQQIVSSLMEVNAIGNADDDENIRLESQRRSSTYEYVNDANKRQQHIERETYRLQEAKKEEDRIQKNLNLQKQKIRAIEQERCNVFKRLLTFYRNKMSKESDSNTTYTTDTTNTQQFVNKSATKTRERNKSILITNITEQVQDLKQQKTTNTHTTQTRERNKSILITNLTDQVQDLKKQESTNTHVVNGMNQQINVLETNVTSSNTKILELENQLEEMDLDLEDALEAANQEGVHDRDEGKEIARLTQALEDAIVKGTPKNAQMLTKLKNAMLAGKLKGLLV